MSLPTLPPDLVLYTRDDYARLQHLLHKGIKPRLLAFSILAFGPCKGLVSPPSPLPSSLPSSPSSSRFFLCFNSLTLLLCACGIVVSTSHLVSAALNTSPNPNSSTAHLLSSIAAQRKRLASDLSKAAAGVFLLVLVALSLAVAFPFAGLTVAGDSATLRSAILLPCLIGGLALSFTLVFVVKHFFEWWCSFKTDPHLWKAMTETTLFGSLFCKV